MVYFYQYPLLTIRPLNGISLPAKYQPCCSEAMTHTEATNRAARNPFAFLDLASEFICRGEQVFQMPDERTLFKDGKKFLHIVLSKLRQKNKWRHKGRVGARAAGANPSLTALAFFPHTRMQTKSRAARQCSAWRGPARGVAGGPWRTNRSIVGSTKRAGQLLYLRAESLRLDPQIQWRKW